ncbi:MAG: aspartate kinase [Candidatus Kapaibacteriota bacterium]|jgi:aspartate kinase
MKVLKFGGTSVKNAEAINNVYNIISNQNDDIVVVVSAMSGVTDILVSLSESKNITFINERLSYLLDKHISEANKLNLDNKTINYIIKQIDELKLFLENNAENFNSKSYYDKIVSYGEVLSSFIVNSYFTSKSLNSFHLDSRNLITTDNEFGAANVLSDVTEHKINKAINNILEDNKIVKTLGSVSNISSKNYNQNTIFVAGGFIASTIEGKSTTLGRGGSDFSGAIYAAMLNAEVLEVWTDVDGILTCDPRLIPNAKLISHLSYLEAAELAYFGAKVLHPKTILPAVERKIPVVVKNTFHPLSNGTAIFDRENNPKMIKAIAFRKKVTVINIVSNRMLGAYGFLNSVFEIFQQYKTSVDLVATSEVSISLTIENESKLTEIIYELNNFSSVTCTKNNAIISVVGEGIKQTAGIAARFFGVLSDINIYMVSVGASEVNLSIVVNQDDMENCVKKLHYEFFEKNELDNSVFIELN